MVQTTKSAYCSHLTYQSFRWTWDGLFVQILLHQSSPLQSNHCVYLADRFLWKPITTTTVRKQRKLPRVFTKKHFWEAINATNMIKIAIVGMYNVVVIIIIRSASVRECIHNNDNHIRLFQSRTSDGAKVHAKAGKDGYSDWPHSVVRCSECFCTLFSSLTTWYHESIIKFVSENLQSFRHDGTERCTK